MKKTLFLLAGALVFLAPGLCGNPFCASPRTADRPIARAAAISQAKESSDEERIRRIENGLLPAVVIKGQPVRGMKLSERMEHYKVPGVSVAFFERGQIVWTRAYGYADVASKRPVTPETRFQAASISKATSALAALRLVQEGKLNLDEDVNVKLRSWKVPENEFTKEQKVTLRRILSHSAGLTVHGFPGYAAGEPLPTIVQILNGEKPANTDPIRVDTIPGTNWRYSGGGYTIMLLLLTEVTGKPFPQILEELVLRPTGMTHSTYQQPLPKNLWPLAATAYRADGQPVKGGFHTYPEMAAAGLWTTPSDLGRMAIEVQNEYAGKSSKILSQDMARQMLAHQKGDWGLGFALGNTDHKLRFGHGGSNEGFQCDLDAYIESGQGLAIMTNSDSGNLLISEIERAIAKEYGWPDFQPKERTIAKINPSVLSPYAGVYELGDLVKLGVPGKLSVTMKGGQLYLQFDRLGPELVELLPESETSFFTMTGLRITFAKDERGAVTRLTLHAGQDYEAKKIS